MINSHTHKNILKQSSFGVLLSGKEGGKGVVVVKKYNPAPQNVKSFTSTTSLTFSGLGTQD